MHSRLFSCKSPSPSLILKSHVLPSGKRLFIPLGTISDLFVLNLHTETCGSIEAATFDQLINFVYFYLTLI